MILSQRTSRSFFNSSIEYYVNNSYNLAENKVVGYKNKIVVEFSWSMLKTTNLKNYFKNKTIATI